MKRRCTPTLELTSTAHSSLRILGQKGPCPPELGTEGLARYAEAAGGPLGSTLAL